MLEALVFPRLRRLDGLDLRLNDGLTSLDGLRRVHTIDDLTILSRGSTLSLDGLHPSIDLEIRSGRWIDLDL